MAHVLLVEAEPGVRDELRAILVAAGHCVELAMSADLARRTMRNSEPDIVVSGFTLPDGSGLDLLDDLEHRGTKTVTLVPQSEAHAERLLVELRDDAYFCRPFTRALLLQIVDAQARHRKARRTGGEKKSEAASVAARLWPRGLQEGAQKLRDKLRA